MQINNNFKAYISILLKCLPGMDQKVKLLIGTAHWFWNSIGRFSAAAVRQLAWSPYGGKWVKMFVYNLKPVIDFSQN